MPMYMRTGKERKREEKNYELVHTQFLWLIFPPELMHDYYLPPRENNSHVTTKTQIKLVKLFVCLAWFSSAEIECS